MRMFSKEMDHRYENDEEVSKKPQKTPVSLLMEICKDKIWETPVFDLLSSEGELHKPVFVYEVNVNGMSAKGVGNSKKLAKHIAAKNLLQRFIIEDLHKDWCRDEYDERSFIELVMSENFGTSSPATTTTSNAEGKNAVGKLQEICMQNSYQFPRYEVIEESGMPHNKTFVVQINLGNFQEIGKHKTKKAAKHEAAQNMITFLQNRDVRACTAKLSIDEKVFDNVLKGNQIDHSTNAHPEGPSSSTYCNDDDSLNSGAESQTKESLSKLLNMNLKHQMPCIDLLDLLNDIGREDNLRIEYNLLPQRKNGDFQCIVKYGESGICAGFGISPEDAKICAAYSCLQHLQLKDKYSFKL